MDREQQAPESPWESPWQIRYLEIYVIDQIRLCHWHYLETGNPLFVFRAIDLGRHLTRRSVAAASGAAEAIKAARAETAIKAARAETASAHYLMDWTQQYLLTAAAELAGVIAQPPAAENVEQSFAAAFGISRDRYKNPFRKAFAIIEQDEIYRSVRWAARNGKKKKLWKT